MPDQSARGPGRPRVLSREERRAIIVEAAEALFLTRGYGETSMLDIAHASGMSKRTVYEMFETKEVLFSAMVLAQHSFAPSFAPPLPGGSAAGDLAAVLTRMGDFVLAPTQLAVIRIVIAESAKVPELARAYYEQGVARAQAVLAESIAVLAKRHGLAVDDPLETANFLFGAVFCETLLLSLVGCAEALPEGVLAKGVLAGRIERVLAVMGPGLGIGGAGSLNGRSAGAPGSSGSASG
ncbi:TetR/AcrR family transcriptional regulator [Zavarzinia sp.]|uniref:TetR/AcrR family transcriptional regulator n=1 Tax=Zavarzinia sp. TaxID=2027920 RepID=UPI00356544BC